MAMSDKPEVENARILVRGETDSPAQAVPRGFLQVIDGVLDAANHIHPERTR